MLQKTVIEHEITSLTPAMTLIKKFIKL